MRSYPITSLAPAPIPRQLFQDNSSPSSTRSHSIPSAPVMPISNSHRHMSTPQMQPFKNSSAQTVEPPSQATLTSALHATQTSTIIQSPESPVFARNYREMLQKRMEDELARKREDDQQRLRQLQQVLKDT